MKKNKILCLSIIILFIINSLTIITAGENVNEPRWITADVGLNMRDSPDLKAKKIGLIPYGEKVLLIEEKGNMITISGATGKWSKVKWKGKVGWVFGGFLTNRAVGIPSTGQILPLPAGIAVGKDSTVTFYNIKGKLLASRNVAGIFEMDKNNIQLAGSLSMGVNSLPLVYYSLENKGKLKLNVNNKITDIASMPNLISLIVAEGKSYLAFVTYNMTSSSRDAMKLYMGNMSELPNMPPQINWGDLPSPNGWDVFHPLAIYYDADQTRGLWFCYTAYGIGGSIYFPILQGLLYLDLKSKKVTEVIDTSLKLYGMSPDQTLIAYNPVAGDRSRNKSGFVIRNLLAGKEAHISLDPKSNLGAGYMVFSPDNKFIAWIEAGGPNREEPEFRLRVARTNGTSILNVPITNLKDFLSVETVSFIQPVGWTNNHLLLLQVHGKTWNHTVLFIWAPDSVQDAKQATVIAEGRFVGFIYP